MKHKHKLAHCGTLVNRLAGHRLLRFPAVGSLVDRIETGTISGECDWVSTNKHNDCCSSALLCLLKNNLASSLHLWCPESLSGPRHVNRASMTITLLRNQNKYWIKSNQINHFYCHITTAHVPWWDKLLRACPRQCRNNLHIYSTYSTYRLIQMTMYNIHIHILSTHSVLLYILTVTTTHYKPYVHILHYVHIYTQ